MKIDDILARKKTVLSMRHAELEAQERGEGDSFNLFMLNEELADLNAQLRALRGAPRSGGHTNSQLSMDHGQYVEWLAADRDEDMHEAHRVYIDALKSGAEVLTERQRELFELWQDGMSVTELAEQFGVDKSTVSRTLARSKTHMREEAERLTKQLQMDSLTLFDLADRDVAKVILSCLTSHQAVCIYLYYGEWLNLRDCGELLGVDHTAVLRTVQRGLSSIQNTLRCGAFTLDNADALSELAYELYLEQGPPDEEKPLHAAKRKLWARRKLGYAASTKKKASPPALCTVRTSDGLTSENAKAHNSLLRPMSKMLKLLFENRAKRETLFEWLKRLFSKLTKKQGNFRR